MNELAKMDISKMVDLEFDCECGKRHKLDIHRICVQKDAIKELPKLIEKFKGEKIFVFSDDNTYEVAGEKVERILKENNFGVKSFILTNNGKKIVPNEEALGKLFMELDKDTSMIVAVGSGCINDLGKYMSAKTNIPYVIVGTAPSMDGYASSGSAFIKGGKKVTLEATLPYGIISDTLILNKAPMELIKAGYGDVIGKITALMDWKLSHKLTGEAYCETCVDLVNTGLKKVIDYTDKIKARDEEGIRYLVEALINTGVAMGLMEISRPASGSEHMLSHFWEMDALDKGEESHLHGIQVATGTVAVYDIFERLKEKLPKECFENEYSKEDVIKLLNKMEIPTSPKELNIDKEVFYNSILKGYKIRDRYSILKFMVAEALEEEISKEITNEMYK